VTRGRWIALAVALVLVAAGVVVGVEAARGTSSASSAAARAATDAAGCRRTTAQVHSTAATTVDGPGARVAVLGDSYTSGYALTHPQDDGYAYVLSRALGWRAEVDGFPGSGFTTDTGCPGERYADRVDRIPTDAVLVVVEGGINDVPAAERVGPAADTLIAAIRARVPAAALVVVGPPLVPARDPGTLQRIGADLARSATQQGATYVDPTSWSLPYVGDGIHLTSVGHRRFAELLGTELAAAHLVPAPPAITP
jgi:lysophospholipase L1-like esterase